MRNCDIKFVNKEITPFGGLSLFFKMLEKCHFEEHVMQCGIPLQGSNRGYKPIQLILGLFAGVWCGASCFGHLDVVRYDAALCDLLGWKRGADKGYNPKRPGRLSHHPLLAFVSDVRMIANYWLRPGNTSASTNDRFRLKYINIVNKITSNSLYNITKQTNINIKTISL